MQSILLDKRERLRMSWPLKFSPSYKWKINKLRFQQKKKSKLRWSFYFDPALHCMALYLMVKMSKLYLGRLMRTLYRPGISVSEG